MNAGKKNNTRGLIHLCGVVMICAFIAGCAPHRRPAEQQGYFGPTEPMSIVTARINANNAAIPTLRATGYFEAHVAVDENRRQFVNGDVTLLYRRPEEVRLIGRKDIAGTIFEAASTPDRYWLIVKGDTDTMWHGHFENVHNVDPREIPIRPDLLLEVLGISEFDADMLRMPAPTMRFNNDADAYMFNFNVRLPDRYAVLKEVWYDRQTLLPKLVLLFDEHGRIVLRAYLSQHEQIDTGLPRDQRPMVATRYQLFFPDNGTTIRFDLNNVALRGGRPAAPNDLSFVFPAAPGVSREVNLDEQPRL